MTSPPPYRYPAPPTAGYDERYTAATYGYGQDPYHQPTALAPVAEDHGQLEELPGHTGHPASGGHVGLARAPAEGYYQNAQIPPELRQREGDTSYHTTSASASYYYPGADYYQHDHPERPSPAPEYHHPYSGGAYHGQHPQESPGPYSYPPRHDTWQQAAHSHTHAQQWSGQLSADPRQAHVYQQSSYGHYPAAPYYAYPPATAYSYPPPPGSSQTTAARSNNKRSIDAASNSSTSPKKKKKKKMYSQFVGVTFNRTHNKYQACITHYRKQHYLGRYRLAADAALAYDESARLLKGPNWKTNFTTREDYEFAKEREIEQVSLKSGTKPRSSIHTVAMKVEEVAEKIGYAGAGRAAVLNPVRAHPHPHHPCSVGPNQYYYSDYDRHHGGITPSPYGPDVGTVPRYEGEGTEPFKNPMYEASADPSRHGVEGEETTPDATPPALTYTGTSSDSKSTGSAGHSQWKSRRGTVIQNGTLAAASALMTLFGEAPARDEGDKNNSIEST